MKTPTLTQFSNASQNKIDVGFLKSIYKYNEESGGEYITGWVTDFFPYLYNKRANIQYKNIFRKENVSERGTYYMGIEQDDIPSGISSVDFV